MPNVLKPVVEHPFHFYIYISLGMCRTADRLLCTFFVIHKACEYENLGIQQSLEIFKALIGPYLVTFCPPDTLDPLPPLVV